MAPVVDMLNHEGLDTHNVEYKMDGDDFVMSTRKAIKQGQEVLTRYGQLSNAHSLENYGFYQAPVHA